MMATARRRCSKRARYGWLSVAAALWLVGSACHPSWAQGGAADVAHQPCPDTFADVYFTPDADKYREGLSPEALEGLPKRHLHLPRAGLTIWLRKGYEPGSPSSINPTRLCDQTAFAAVDVLYYPTSDIARRLGVPYPADTPSPFGDQLILSGMSRPAPVNDVGDREGVARNGYWIFDNKRGPYSAIYYFCVPPLGGPPRLHGPCYVTADTQHMGYTTGHFSLSAQPFLSSTFYATDLKTKSFLRLVTPEIIEHYFAFLRALAPAIIVDPSSSSEK